MPGNRLKIMQQDEPKEQYYLGKKLTPTEEQWNEKTAKQVMEAAIRAKFEQNQNLRTCIELLNVIRPW